MNLGTFSSIPLTAENAVVDDDEEGRMRQLCRVGGESDGDDVIGLTVDDGVRFQHGGEDAFLRGVVDVQFHVVEVLERGWADLLKNPA